MHYGTSWAFVKFYRKPIQLVNDLIHRGIAWGFNSVQFAKYYLNKFKFTDEKYNKYYLLKLKPIIKRRSDSETFHPSYTERESIPDREFPAEPIKIAPFRLFNL